MKAVEALLLGVATALIVSGISAFLQIRMVLFQLYAYVFLALIVYLRASGVKLSDVKGLSDRLLLVVDEEERRVKKLISGEEFKIESSEKVQ
ncbi:hypothetical protein HRED_02770 [Candidatus Haloredivivus sp. G17]|jgi:hypothetical protein|nr:hypothetical protein HRED_02770 [Candidatus Haloredivivus sp. G17]